MIRGITFLKCQIYFWHLVATTVSQNLLIPSTNSALFFWLHLPSGELSVHAKEMEWPLL